jgi:membrane fusion protein (multidrug efflux system)
MRATRAVRIDRRGGFVVAAGVLMALGTAGCGSSETAANEDGATGEAAYVKVVNVEVRTLESADFTSYIRLTGAVEAYEDVVVSSQESGVIERVIVDKGSRVRAGQPIIQIDDEILTAQVDEARAAASLAGERFERQRQLWEDESIGSEIAFLQTKYDAQSAEARLAFLEARLARHTIKSPISGVLDGRYVDVGELVAPGTPVARVLTIDRLKVVGGVPERYGPYVDEGGRAVLDFDVLLGQSIEGTIAYVGAAVDPQNRTFPIEVLLDNPEGRLKPQMIANVRLATEKLQGVIVVPQDVVLRTENGYEVFVVAESANGSIAEARPVDLGPSFENEVVVASGLAAGDRLIVTGHQMVDAGDRVREVSEGSGR